MQIKSIIFLIFPLNKQWRRYDEEGQMITLLLYAFCPDDTEESTENTPGPRRWRGWKPPSASSLPAQFPSSQPTVKFLLPILRETTANTQLKASLLRHAPKAIYNNNKKSWTAELVTEPGCLCHVTYIGLICLYASERDRQSINPNVSFSFLRNGRRSSVNA